MRDSGRIRRPASNFYAYCAESDGFVLRFIERGAFANLEREAHV